MPRADRERIHFHLASTPGASPEDALEHLLTIGADRRDDGCPDATGLIDVDGNDLCLVELLPAVARAACRFRVRHAESRPPPHERGFRGNTLKGSTNVATAPCPELLRFEGRVRLR